MINFHIYNLSFNSFWASILHLLYCQFSLFIKHPKEMMIFKLERRPFFLEEKNKSIDDHSGNNIEIQKRNNEKSWK